VADENKSAEDTFKDIKLPFE